MPNAITDGDSIVHFRRSDVIVTGDIFSTTQYPFIDVKNGGSLQGEIQALNFILDKTVYVHDEDGVCGGGVSKFDSEAVTSSLSKVEGLETATQCGFQCQM